jgi:hypothetical protein
MNKKDFYIGQKVLLPKEYYTYHLEDYGSILQEYATVTSLEKLNTDNLVHYEIEVMNGMVPGSTIHSGVDYRLLKEYE